MEIDKKIILKLIQVLEDLKKSSKGIDIKSDNTELKEEIDLSDKIIIKSPIVGTAYLAPEPGGKKFVENGQKIIIGIRPEYLFPSNNGIPAKIAVVEPTGSETHLLLRANDQDLTCVIRERENYSPGQEVKLTTDQNSIHIFNYENKLRIY